MQVAPIKRASTFFLKAVIILIGAVVLTACAFAFPQLWKEGAREIPEYAYALYPGLLGFYVTIIPFFIALYQAFRLLHHVDQNNAFSELSVRALSAIKFCAIAMSVLYATAMPLVYILAELDDAPGLIVIGSAFVFAPLVVATVIAVVQKLLQSAIDMKAELDVTV